MNETMGQTIRQLRQRRGMTQEELAEILGVTFQAVSKWENDAGMPDISQVVPLATVFDVSTDVLFGTNGKNKDAEVLKIIEEAQSYLAYPVTKEMIKAKYDRLHEGLKKYPGNCALLTNCLEAGISLAYPANSTYDAENGKAIYKKCIREADIVVKYSKSTTDILRAHMIMVLLHSAYGNFDEARSHADEFPWRADMTVNEMYGYIARWEKDLREESKRWQTDFMYHFEAMLDDTVDTAMCAFNGGEYEVAIECLNQALAFIALVCKDEKVAPRFHVREAGDIHFLLAKTYLKNGQKENAISELRKMTEYDIGKTAEFISGAKLNSPLLHDVDFDFFRVGADYKACLLSKLNSDCFDEIRDMPEFREMVKSVTDSYE